MSAKATIEDALISAATVAQTYEVSEKTVWLWAKAGRIPAPVMRGKNCTRWRKSDILRHIRELKHEAMAEAAK